MPHLGLGEEVAPGPVLARVELLRYLGARLEPQHGHVIEAIIPEQKPASRAEDGGEAGEHPGVRVEYFVRAYFLFITILFYTAKYSPLPRVLVWLDGGQDEDAGEDVHTGRAQFGHQAVGG